MISQQAKSLIAESTQQKVIQLNLVSQKKFIFSHAESTAENFQIFTNTINGNCFEVSFELSFNLL